MLSGDDDIYFGNSSNGGGYKYRYSVNHNDKKAHDPESLWHMSFDERAQRVDYILRKYGERKDDERIKIDTDKEIEGYFPEDISDYEKDKAEEEQELKEEQKIHKKRTVKFKPGNHGRDGIMLKNRLISNLYQREYRKVRDTVRRFEKKFGYEYDGPAKTRMELIQTQIGKIISHSQTLKRHNYKERLRDIHNKIQNIIQDHVDTHKSRGEYIKILKTIVGDLAFGKTCETLIKLINLLTAFITYLEKEDGETSKGNIYEVQKVLSALRSFLLFSHEAEDFITNNPRQNARNQSHHKLLYKSQNKRKIDSAEEDFI